MNKTIKFALAAFMGLFGLFSVAGSAQALQPGNLTKALAEDVASSSLLQKVYYNPRRIRRICGRRWGWGTWRFRRCVRRRAGIRRPGWRRVCARRWGYGTWRYRRCVRRRGGVYRPYRRCARVRARCARIYGYRSRYRRCIRRSGC